MKKSFFGIIAAAVAVQAASAAVPEAQITSVKAFAGSIEVSYSLASDAIVTVGVLTNTAAGFVRVAPENVVSVDGDAFKTVAGAPSRRFVWNAWRDIPDARFQAESLKVELKVWPTNNPPDYLIVDTTQKDANNKFVVRWYPCAEAVPYGITNDLYKTTMFPMRRIHAKGVKWQMGSYGEYQNNDYVIGGREQAHLVTLDHDYYIAVYEMTSCHSTCLNGGAANGDTKPIKNVAYTAWRGSNSHWPNPPAANSAFDARSKKLPFAIDYPSEAEWEFAARGGYGEERWGDGSKILNNAACPNLSRIAHFGGNNGPGGWSGSYTNVGTKASNAYGLYDMNGNLREITLDWYQLDITWNSTGEPNSNGMALLDGTSRADSDYIVARGGCYASNTKDCRPAFREPLAANSYTSHTGFRCVAREIVK